MSDIQAAFKFCQDHLKAHDPYLYFAALTIPQHHRNAVIALHAFLTEIKRIPWLVSGPDMGEIRLQWWHDWLTANATATVATGNEASIGPIGQAVASVQKNYDLPIDRLTRMIDAYRFDLYNDPIADPAAFDAYAQQTQSLPLMLTAQILNGGVEPAGLDDVCRETARAVVLSSKLFSWPRDARQQKLFLPLSVFHAHGLDLDDIWKQTDKEAMRSGIAELCAIAEDRLTSADSMVVSLADQNKSHLSSAFLCLAPARLSLEARQRAPFADCKLSRFRAYWRIMHLAFRL